MEFDLAPQWLPDEVREYLSGMMGSVEKAKHKEAEKLRCGRKHFEAIGADYDVVTSAEEV